ncbi:MAG: hypothetical protein ACI8XG_001924 [Congregibacter sp.]|jgi:hypothetical protein
MFDKFSEEMTTSAQPTPNLTEMNGRTLELISKQQTLLSTGLMDDSVQLVENLTDQTELKIMLVAQSVFAESMRERIAVVSKMTYTQLADIHAELIKNDLTTVCVKASVKE